LTPPAPSPGAVEGRVKRVRWLSRDVSIAAVALGGILLHVVMRWVIEASAPFRDLPLQFVLLVGGGPLVVAVMRRVLRGRFDADILALVSIVASAILQEYVAGAVIVLMLSGGSALEQYATRRASSVLEALAARMPHTAHRVRGETTEDVPASAVRPGDDLILFPHEACPVDGVVLSGHGSMNEAYLTGEPYLMAKLPGAAVLSGALNGETALTIRASKPAADSRYAQILKVVRETEQNQPAIRRLAERLGAWYTPVAIGVATAAGVVAGDAGRFLAVIVVATPCPLLIAIPVAVIGAISRAAKKGILIRKAAALENIDRCRVLDRKSTRLNSSH